MNLELLSTSRLSALDMRCARHSLKATHYPAQAYTFSDPCSYVTASTNIQISSEVRTGTAGSGLHLSTNHLCVRATAPFSLITEPGLLHLTHGSEQNAVSPT